MNRLNELPDITNHVLSGLKADDRLKTKIRLKAADLSLNDVSFSGTEKHFRLLPVLCAIALLMLLSLSLLQKAVPHNGSLPEIQTFAAGEHKSSSPLSIQRILSEADENAD